MARRSPLRKAQRPGVPRGNSRRPEGGPASIPGRSVGPQGRWLAAAARGKGAKRPGRTPASGAAGAAGAGWRRSVSGRRMFNQGLPPGAGPPSVPASPAGPGSADTAGFGRRVAPPWRRRVAESPGAGPRARSGAEPASGAAVAGARPARGWPCGGRPDGASRSGAPGESLLATRAGENAGGTSGFPRRLEAARALKAL
jgi:hypothetical protein